MTVQGQLLDMLEAVAAALGDDLRARLVFIGGCSTALLISDDNILQDIRATDDVDLIVDLAGRVQWYQLVDMLQDRGFTISADEGPTCRLLLGDIKVDFMPLDGNILGFSNRWYKKAIATAIPHNLPSGLAINGITPPLFLATKLEAYIGRGNNDPLSSHDLEDILLIIDGREQLAAEVAIADADVRTFIAEQLASLKAHPDFEYLLYGNIKGPEGRVDIVSARLDAIVESGA